MQDLKRFIMASYFLGPWSILIYWDIEYNPPLWLWAIICFLLFLPWLILGNKLTVYLFPEFGPNYGKQNKKRNKRQ